MKKALFVLTIIALLGVAGSLLLNYLNTDINRESKNFIDKTIPTIISRWDADKLIEHASPELLKNAPPNKIRASFDSFREKYGSLETYLGSKGEVGIYLERDIRIITATYAIDARFQKSTITLHVQLIRKENQWQISAFHVGPKVNT